MRTAEVEDHDPRDHQGDPGHLGQCQRFVRNNAPTSTMRVVPRLDQTA